MLINLVRIQFFKLCHSRYVRWGAVVYILATAALLFALMSLATDPTIASHPSFAEATEDERKILFVTLYLNFAVLISYLYVGGAIINLLANHYEYREKINVSGIVRSPSLWYTSELIMSFISCAFLGIYVIITEHLMVMMLNIKEYHVLDGDVNAFLLFLGGTISVFYVTAPCIPVTKFFRKHNVSVAISVAYVAFRTLFLIFFAGFTIGATSDSSEVIADQLVSTQSTSITDEMGDQLVDFIIDPGNALVNISFGGTIQLSKILFVGITIVRLVFYPLLGYIAARRKNDV